MKIRYLIAAAVASVAIPAFAGTGDDLSLAAQAASKTLASDAAIGMSGGPVVTVDGVVTMSGKGFDVNGGYPPPVPEPEGWAMLAGGLALVGLVARRRRR
ncbi:PEP-CTERM sorting domain-containing protein [Zemynaea arenosa]|uniref:PEP-CTERM sorting domain-containing protein n=1 Tax=Zemynaea arenosa TaxID=2561931 RepID=UPI001E2ABE6B|nr:PEP-CTERM sorting domain-containing protein [Massilia arenosa]